MSETRTQKALAITSKGGPFTLIRHAIPTPGPGDVLVKMQGVGLNPAEWKFQVGLFDDTEFINSYPAFLGTEGAGIVVEVGSDVSTINKGDRVLFQGWITAERTTFQEYALVEAELVARIPETLTTLQAAAIPMGLTTAALGLGHTFPASVTGRGGAGLKPIWEDGAKGYYSGRAILIFGGASMVGQFTIQIAKYLGFSPIIVTSSLKHTDGLVSMGATHVIDRYTTVVPAVEKLKRELNVQIEVVYDAVHVPVTQAEVDLMAPNGTLVGVFPAPDELQFRDGRRATSPIGSFLLYKDLGKEMFARIQDFLQKGIIKPVSVEKLDRGLAGIAEGLGRLQRNEVSGKKLVVDPTETPDF
ncbi:chaperonin 10-like protein [Mycena rosella]|uniref:Chaperonin 10-like protein n=1 Tax=Mycena rosella TaxID=1033263 RepID=A0AAD7GZJ7_MYCRO|nr:chaperonin 10-like protein [Mycena rosella]